MFFKKQKTDEFTAQTKAEIISKLLEKYRKMQKEHGVKLFDTAKLEERINFQRAHQSDFERFILEEMNFFKKMETRANEEAAKKKRQDEADARMREIMAANDAMIAHYPDIFFHPMATLECRRIVGAVSNLFPEIAEELRYVFQGRKEWNEINFYLFDLERFIYKPPMRMTAFLAAYVAEMQKWGDAGRDDADRKFMQTAAMCLTGLAQELKKSMPSLIEADVVKASACVGQLEAIVTDFRLNDWAEHGLKLKAIPKTERNSAFGR